MLTSRARFAQIPHYVILHCAAAHITTGGRRHEIRITGMAHPDVCDAAGLCPVDETRPWYEQFRHLIVLGFAASSQASSSPRIQAAHPLPPEASQWNGKVQDLAGGPRSENRRPCPPP